MDWFEVWLWPSGNGPIAVLLLQSIKSVRLSCWIVFGVPKNNKELVLDLLFVRHLWNIFREVFFDVEKDFARVWRVFEDKIEENCFDNNSFNLSTTFLEFLQSFSQLILFRWIVVSRLIYHIDKATMTLVRLITCWGMRLFIIYIT